MAAAAPKIGDLLQNRFRISRELGQGASGKVYLAQDTLGNRNVALKFMHPSPEGDSDLPSMFDREYRAIRALNHPNTIQVFDQYPGFFAMEYIDGATLPTTRLTDISQLVKLGMEICRALSYIHRTGLIHGDLKPAHVMLDRRGNLKLIDFGLARQASVAHAVTMDDMVLQGTVAYMAPEQIKGLGADARSDLYSLGVMLYELATGQAPFEGADFLQMAKHHLHTAPTPPRKLAPELPEPLEALLLKLLAKEPSERYQAAEEVGRELQGLSGRREIREQSLLTGAQYLFDPAFVGREPEMQLLNDFLAKAQEEQGQLVFLRGPSGIGKTRLLREFKAAHLFSDTIVLSGRPASHNGAYQPFFVELLDQACKAMARLDPDRLHEKLWEWSLALGGFQSEARADWFVDNIPIIAAQMPKFGIGIITTLIRQLLEQRPVILLTDDMEAISGFGGQLLEAIANWIDESRCLLCVAHADEALTGHLPLVRTRSRLKAAGQSVEIQLSPLDQKNLAFFIASMVSQSELDRTLVRNIAEITKGNPLFVLETVRSLANQKVIYRQGANWTVDETQVQEFKLPTELEGILMSRLEGLGKIHRRVLFTMATARTPVSFSLLRRLTRLSELDLFYTLGDLQSRGLVKAEESDRETSYAMTNDQVASRVYQEGRKKVKARLHGQFAEDLEKRFAFQPDPVIAELIYHTLAAGQTNKAIRYILRAGDMAEAAGSFKEANEHYRSALKRLDREREEETFIDLCLRTGRVSRRLGHLDIGASYLLKGLDLAETRSRVSADLAHELGRIYRHQGNTNDAIRYLHYSLNSFESHGVQSIGLRIDFAQIYLDVANYGLTEQYLAEAEALIGEKRDTLPEAYLLECDCLCNTHQAAVAIRTGRLGRARERLGAAASLVETVESVSVQMECQLMIGQAYAELGNLNRASTALAACVPLTGQAEDKSAQIGQVALQAQISAERGAVNRALTQTEQAIKLASKIDAKWALGSLLLLQARLLLEKHSNRDVAELCTEAARLLGAAGDKRGVGRAQLLLGRAARQAGNYEQAVRYITRSRDLFEQIGALWEIAEADLERAEIDLRRQEPDPATDRLVPALASLKTTENRPLEGRLLHALAAADVQAGRHTEARRRYQQATDLVREPLAPLELARLREGLGLYLLGGQDRAADETEEAEGFDALTEATDLYFRCGLDEQAQRIEGMIQKFQHGARSRELSLGAHLERRYDITEPLGRMKTEIESRLHGIAQEVNQTMPNDHEAEQTKRLVDEKIKSVESTVHVQLDEMKAVNDRLKRDIAFLMDEKQGLATLQTISRAINSETDLDRLITMIIDLAIEQVHAERGFLILRNADGKYVFREARNIDQHTIDKPEFKVSFTIAKRVVKTGEPILTANALEDARFKDKLSVHDLKLKSVLCVPLKQADQVLGAVYVDNRFVSGLFSERDLDALGTIAGQAAIGLQKAQLLYENRARKQEVEKLNQQLERKYRKQQDELLRIKEELRRSREAMMLRYDYSNIIGNTPPMQEIFRILDKVTDTRVPVLIGGESGTGKELVARALHFNGPLKNMPFAAENCAALSETLLESELFGHVKGAFTGADRDKKGVFEIADGGTLFLDEIGDMSPGMQKKLLRVLQEGEFRPVGAKETRSVKVRIVAATNKNLTQMKEDGTFREDLYYRLNVVAIQMPPLRDRMEDLPPLVLHFLSAIAEETGRPKCTVDADAIQAMLGYRWPGNIRELENEVARAVALCDGHQITREQLSPNVLLANSPANRHATADQPTEPPTLSLKEMEKRTIIAAIHASNGNKVEAARKLGIDRTTLYNKIRRYEIET